MPCCNLLLLPLLLLLAAGCSRTSAEEIWFGTSPFCDGQPRDCPIFDMEFVRSDSRGDGKACLTGTKVLCRSTPLRRQLVDTSSSQLAVVTYNIFERPFFITHDGQTERSCHVPRALLSKLPAADVLVFQEAFMGGCWYTNPRVSMRAELSRYGFPFATEIVNSASEAAAAGGRRSDTSPYFVINGGVFIASRWPIEATEQLRFAESGHADRFSKKGAVYARLRKGDRVYHVFGTHMQAQPGSQYDRIRVNQAAELRQFVAKQQIPATEAAIIAGDLNCDLVNNPTNVANVLNAMGAVRPPIVGDVDATLDPETNDVVEPGNHLREWLDFVVYSRSHLRPLAAQQQAFRLTADKPITYCNSAKLQPFYVWPWSSLCHRTKTTVHMSDHYPVLGSFRFA